MKKILPLLLAVLELVPVRAQISIDTVLIGDAGNAADSSGYGAVGYAYRMGTYEVTLAQYSAFLNAVASTNRIDTYTLYSTSLREDENSMGISRTGVGANYVYAPIGTPNRPVTFVTWFDAARFANWMANGQPTGAQDSTTTENGAYALNGAMSGNSSITRNAINPNTGQAPTWFLPSENEWYKAAYYKGGGTNAGYWMYATQSDTRPGNVVGSAENQMNFKDFDNGNIYSVTQNATYNANQNYLTEAGAFTNSESAYGTFDQGGNVWEWNETDIIGSRGRRGGCWSSDNGIRADFRGAATPTNNNSDMGFRVATVPEPSTAALLLLSAAAGVLARRRPRTARPAHETASEPFPAVLKK